jgi:hypothetical protein
MDMPEEAWRKLELEMLELPELESSILFICGSRRPRMKQKGEFCILPSFLVTTTHKMLHFFVLATFIGATLASYGANLNYRSPSLHHPALGISLRKVVKRHVERQSTPASQLNFTHGVASGDPFPNSVILWTRCSPVSVPTGCSGSSGTRAAAIWLLG